jgi:AAA domain
VSERFQLRVFSGPEISGLPDQSEDELAGPYVRRGARTIVVADPGHGKTTLVAQLIAAILSGGEVLGHRAVEPSGRPALVVDLEQGMRTIKRVLRESGLDERDDLLYISCQDGLALDTNKDHLDEFHRIIEAHRPAVVALDPFYKAHRGDANEERAVVDLMRVLDGLRVKFGFALLLPAHPRKDVVSSNGARKLTLHDVAGSGAITRGAELVLALERLSPGSARLRILKDRDGDLPVGEAFPLSFERGRGFRLDPKEEQAADELEQRIFDNSDDWRTVKEWAGLLSIREKRAKDLLEQLVESGLVQTEVGPAGRSPRAHCYRTAPAGWAQSDAVTQSPLDEMTAPTAPTSIGDVALGAVNGSDHDYSRHYSPGAAADPADDELEERARTEAAPEPELNEVTSRETTRPIEERQYELSAWPHDDELVELARTHHAIDLERDQAGAAAIEARACLRPSRARTREARPE